MKTLREYLDKRNAYMREYRQKNLEKMRAYGREKQKEYRERKLLGK